MPTFETPPEWWVNLANLTQWLHWPAIAAGVAGLAWWRTGNLANRANRREERKDALQIAVAAQYLDVAYTKFEIFIRNARRGPLPLCLVDHSDDPDIQVVKKFAATKLPSLAAFMAFGHALHALNAMTELFEHAEKTKRLPDISEVAMFLGQGQASVAELRDLARKRVSANEWARLHDEVPPWSWEGVVQALKSLLAWLPLLARRRKAG